MQEGNQIKATLDVHDGVIVIMKQDCANARQRMEFPKAYERQRKKTG